MTVGSLKAQLRRSAEFEANAVLSMNCACEALNSANEQINTSSFQHAETVQQLADATQKLVATTSEKDNALRMMEYLYASGNGLTQVVHCLNVSADALRSELADAHSMILALQSQSPHSD